MTQFRRLTLVLGALSLFPVPAVLAQTGGSSTADHARLGGQTGSPATPSPGGTTASQNSNVPGATGRTVVPGTNSTVGGDSTGTALGRTGGSGEGGGSGR